MEKNISTYQTESKPGIKTQDHRQVHQNREKGKSIRKRKKNQEKIRTVLKAEMGAEENSRRRRDLRRTAVAIDKRDRQSCFQNLFSTLFCSCGARV